MKKHIAILALCFAAAPIIASAQSDEDFENGHVQWQRVSPPPVPPGQVVNGLNEAAEVCGQLSYDSNKPACLSIIEHSQFFDLNAVQVCRGRDYDSYKMDCLKAAANKNFYPAAVLACGHLSYDSNVVDCINAVANKSFLPAEVKVCAEASYDQYKIDCFKNGGRPMGIEPPAPPIEERSNSDRYILGQLRIIQEDITHARIPRALLRLASLIDYIDRHLERSREPYIP